MSDYDDPLDGAYPTEEELAVLDTFEGTPHAFVDYLQEIYQHGYGNMQVVKGQEYAPGWRGEKTHRITLVTGGWSGNEEIISRITHPEKPGDSSLFQMKFWESTHRGGKFVYDVPESRWEESQYLGLFSKWPDAEQAAARLTRKD